MEIKDIRTAVTDRLKGSGEHVQQILMDKFTADEVDRRVGLILLAYNKLEGFENDLRKIRPDNVSYDLEGTETSSGYSKANIDKIKSCRKNIDQLTKLIENCLNTPTPESFDVLKKQIGGGGSGDRHVPSAEKPGNSK